MLIYKDETIILECYKLSNKQIKEIVDDLVEDRKELKCEVSRTKQSYVNEIKVHKFLYKLGIAKERTRDANLEENINKKLEAAYMIIGSFL